jgi:hypothetical protein
MNNGAEIVLRVRDLAAQALDKATANVKAYGANSAKAMDQLARSSDAASKKAEAVLKLMDKGFSSTESVKLANTWDAAARKAEAFGQTYGKATANVTQSTQNASMAAQLLSREIGVQMPEAVGRFLAKSQAIGPVLTGAFSAIAVVGLIQTLTQLPAIFEKITGAITGWNDVSKKAYADFISDNERAVKAAQDFKIKLLEVQNIGLTGSAKSSGDWSVLKAQIDQKAQEVAGFLKAGNALRNQPSPYAAGDPRQVLFKPESSVKADEQFEKAAKAGAELLALQRQLPEAVAKLNQALVEEGKADVEAAKKAAEAAKTVRAQILATQDAYMAFWNSASIQFRYQLPNAAKEGFDALDQRAELSLQRAKEILADRDYWIKASQDFNSRNRFTGNDEVAAGEAVGRANGQKILKQFEDAKRASEKFVNDFRDGAGKVWDSFFNKGQNVLAKLSNFALGILNSIGRSLFQNIATSIATGSSGSQGGLAIPGIGGKGGLLGLASKIPGIGGLFGATTAATPAASSAILGAFPLMTAPGAVATGGVIGAGGIGGALGLGGGSGLLGLGAATIPVFGAIAAGAIFGLSKLFKHRPEAPFISDPNAAERSRTIFFTNLAETQGRLADVLDRFSDKFSVAKPGDVVMAGLSNNTVRRKVTGKVLDDDI